MEEYGIWIGIMVSLMAVCAVFITITPFFVDKKINDKIKEINDKIKELDDKFEKNKKDVEGAIATANAIYKKNQILENEVKMYLPKNIN